MISAATFSPLAATSLPAGTRVCIVTGELVGPHKNGGLGTSMTGLAELLAAHGGDVTVLYTGAISEDDLPTWQARYRGAGIALRGIEEWQTSRVVGPMAAMSWTNAYALYEILQAERFDIIHFNDTMGEGVYCFVAKRLGSAFQDTLLCLALHSPTEWILHHNSHVPNWLGFAFFTTAERLSISAADLLWCPSRYLLDWIGDHRYALPAQVFNQQYVIPTGDLFAAGRAKCDAAAEPIVRRERSLPKEIVFFGRLEERKGLRLFTSAVTTIADELTRRGVRVLFMGKPSAVGEVPGDHFVRSRSAPWGFQWRIESGFGQREAVSYLRDNACLAVMASPVDNSPCTIYEALQFGIPFIASRTGGIPELVHLDDHAEHLFDYTIRSLSERILAALDRGIGIARPAVSVAENQNRWLAMHADWRRFAPTGAGVAAAPRRFAALIDHAGEAEALSATVGSLREAFGEGIVSWAVLRRQLAPLADIAGVSFILVDEFTDITPPQVIAAFREAGADALLAVRSGARLMPGARAVFEAALRSGNEAALPAARIANVPAVVPALGGAALGFFEGEFETGVLATRLDALYFRLGEGLPALDRDRQYFGIGDELQVCGAVIWPIPEPLVCWETGRDFLVPLMGIARRTATFARAPEHERYQMLGIGRHTYRSLFPASEPRPAGLMSRAASAAVGSALIAMPAVGGARARLSRLLRSALGARGFSLLSRLVHGVARTRRYGSTPRRQRNPAAATSESPAAASAAPLTPPPAAKTRPVSVAVRPVIPAWRDIVLPPEVTASQTMLMQSEQRLLFALARDHFRNAGYIVDAGCFLGGSTLALAHGLLANQAFARCPRRTPIHSYDLFQVEAWTIGLYFPRGTPPGMSFEQFYRNNIANVSHLIDVNVGDITVSKRPPGPIEILFIDLAKHWTVSDYLVRHFFPMLIPGHSIVVQQDYLYQIGTGWLPVTMEYFSEFFEIADHTELNSVAFHYRKPIPPDLLDRDVIQSLTRREILALADRAIARFDGQQRAILIQSRDDFQATLAELSWPA